MDVFPPLHAEKVGSAKGATIVKKISIDVGGRPLTIESGRLAKQMESAGAGEILITSIDHDGCMDGYM